MADNTVTVVGNVTRDPEIRYTPSGQANASFGVAVNRRWQNRQTNEWEERVSFFNVVCWREMAENVAESLGKGSRVVVTGRLEQRSWETENGEKRSVVEIVADEVGPEPAVGDRRDHPQRARGAATSAVAAAAGRWRQWRRSGGGSGDGGRRGRRQPPRQLRRLRRGALLMARERRSPARTRPRIGGARRRRRCRSSTPRASTWIDYKDVNLLRRFMSERAKIRARRVTGNSAQQQRAVARAIRVAREMALLPYSVRQVTQRKGGRRDRGDRELREEYRSRAGLRGGRRGVTWRIG